MKHCINLLLIHESNIYIITNAISMVTFSQNTSPDLTERHTEQILIYPIGYNNKNGKTTTQISNSKKNKKKTQLFEKVLFDYEEYLGT